MRVDPFEVQELLKFAGLEYTHCISIKHCSGLNLSKNNRLGELWI